MNISEFSNPQASRTSLAGVFNKTLSLHHSPTSTSGFNKSTKSILRAASPSQVHELDPELITESKVLPQNLEQTIKEGFYELKQKFKEGEAQTSIYVSHIVLHEHHPVFSKLDIDTLKILLTESSIISLSPQ